ncbi:MAG: hypothetical protein KY460_00925 [Actinobacteria bacterium]|nr:hypothetical protein [Actinomycetota bacterium]
MRVTMLVAVMAVLVTACGNSSPPLAETSTDRLQLEIVTSPDPLITGEPATFDLRVRNVSDQRALLTFDTTQRGDVAFLTNGVEVYRWAERRAFAHDPHRVALVPGQQVRFELDVGSLPVAPGEYEVMATATGMPKLRTVRRPITVTGDVASETASPEPTATPSPSQRYEQLTSAVETTTADLALPLASALADSDAFDAEGAVVRQEIADAFARLTFAELLLAYQVVTDGDVEGARVLAESAAGQVAETIGRLRSVQAVDRRAVVRLLRDHVAVVEEYATVVDAGGGEPLEAPRAELEQISAELGPLIAVTAGEVIETDAATELFRTWTDAVLEAVREGAQVDTTVQRAHQAATEAVEPLGLEVARSYVEHLDLDGFETTTAVLRQEIASQLIDEVFLLATAVDVGELDRAAVADVLDENADELAEAIGRAPAIDASEESAFLQLWKERDAALLDVATSSGGEISDELATTDDEIARLLADAAPDALDADELRSWLGTQRRALIRGLRGLTG